jgi:diguanylate cyclase (GGDEF)-like protein
VLSLISNGLVLSGVLILLGSLVTVRQIIQRLPLGRSQTSWYAMAGMIILFVLGYLGYVGIFWERQLQMLDLVVPGVFFFGACFVWISSILSLQTAMDVMRITMLEQETFTDPLTGLFNRRYMDQRLREEIAKARRYGLDLAVMMLDLDHFKQVNDKHGHQAGDQLLIDLGAIVTRELRDSDILARYGGEEFFVIAPSTAPADAVSLAERIRECIEAHEFKLDPNGTNKPGKPVTVSIGVSNFGGSINSGEELIRLADKNLYQAKNAGRNKIIGGRQDD